CGSSRTVSSCGSCVSTNTSADEVTTRVDCSRKLTHTTEGGTVSATGTACNTTTETPPKAYDNLMTSTNFTKWCVTSAPTASVPKIGRASCRERAAFAIDKDAITTRNDDGTRDR